MKMNIQKSRLAALVGLMLMVCMMVAMLAVPASAATFETTVGFGFVYSNKLSACFYEMANAELHDHETYSDLAVSLGDSLDSVTRLFVCPDGNGVYLESVNRYVDAYNTAYPETPIEAPHFSEYTSLDGKKTYYKIPAPGCVESVSVSNATKFTYTTTGKLVDSLEDNSLSGVLNQIIDLLPIVIPVLIGFIGLDKAIKFITGVLHSA